MSGTLAHNLKETTDFMLRRDIELFAVATDYGAFEGRTFVEVGRDFPAEYERFRTRDPHYAPPGGESAAQFRDRVMGALERIAAEAAGKRVAVVTHGGVLGIAYRHAMGIPLEARSGHSLANASLNHVRRVDGRWLIEAWGDVAHLPAESVGES